MKTSPSNLKVRQVITQMKAGALIPRPEFQRRLVWTPEDKIRFIDTVLKKYPFPEVYVANGETNVDTGEGTQLLVDGQQRMTAIFDYFNGDAAYSGAKVPQYSELSRDEKEEFLNYDVAVRDLGTITHDQIIEVFRRINSTNYSLNDLEINNAVYAGEFMRVAAGFAEHSFFEEHKIFRVSDIKRMGDVRFILQIIITLMHGYFNRDELFEEYLQTYNDNFPDRQLISSKLLRTFDFIDECGFPSKSRIWKRSDLFTAIIEITALLDIDPALQPSVVLDRLERFYRAIEDDMLSIELHLSVYYKATLQASNDRLNRLRRGVIVNCILLDENPDLKLLELGLD